MGIDMYRHVSTQDYAFEGKQKWEMPCLNAHIPWARTWKAAKPQQMGWGLLRIGSGENQQDDMCTCAAVLKWTSWDMSQSNLKQKYDKKMKNNNAMFFVYWLKEMLGVSWENDTSTPRLVKLFPWAWTETRVGNNPMFAFLCPSFALWRRKTQTQDSHLATICKDKAQK